MNLLNTFKNKFAKKGYIIEYKSYEDPYSFTLDYSIRISKVEYNSNTEMYTVIPILGVNYLKKEEMKNRLKLIYNELKKTDGDYKTIKKMIKLYYNRNKYEIIKYVRKDF